MLLQQKLGQKICQKTAQHVNQIQRQQLLQETKGRMDLEGTVIKNVFCKI